MSDVDVALLGIIAVIVGGLIIWFIFYAFSGQTKPPSNLTQETLRRLVIDWSRHIRCYRFNWHGACEQRGVLCEDVKGDYSEGDYRESYGSRWFDAVGREDVDWFLTATACVAAVVALVAGPCTDHDHSTVLTRRRVRLIVKAREGCR
jgi:hypothetical protein